MILLYLLIRKIRKLRRREKILRLFIKMGLRLWRLLLNLFILMELSKKILIEEQSMEKIIDYHLYYHFL
jgi:hypothetical protein